MSSELFTPTFLRSTAELAVRGAAHVALLAIGGDVFDVWHADWKTIAGAALGGAVLSVLTSLSLIKVGQPGSPLVTADGTSGQ